MYGLLISESQTLLDEQGSKHQTQGFGRSTNSGDKLRCISIFQVFPRHQRREQNPLVFGVQCAAKGQMELLDLQLAIMLLSVHVWRSTGAAIKDLPVPGQFIGTWSLRPVAP